LPATAVAATAFPIAGANNLALSINFANTSQFGTAFGVNSLSQNGYTSGHMTGFSTGSDGMIAGRYSNGQTRTLGQVVLANFSNPQGLQPLGGNQWAETAPSGSPLVGSPGSASLGVLQTSAVEDSNVDLTAELVNMITAQRVYQANAQTIKTQDQVLQTIVNLR
jgi:flagellar hook protein FlgE